MFRRIRAWWTALWPSPAKAVDASDQADEGLTPVTGPPGTFTFGPAIDLDRAMRQTARSRFAAAKRLQSRDRKMTRLTGFASAYLIALTVIPYFLSLPEVVEDHVNLVAVFFAVTVLVSSLLQYSQADIVAAEQHHRSALETNELIREFVADAPTVAAQEYLEMSRRYNAVLQKYSINHDDVDYHAVILQRPHEYNWATPRKLNKMWLNVKMTRWAADIVLIFLTTLLGAMILFYVLPSDNRVASQRQDTSSTNEIGQVNGGDADSFQLAVSKPSVPQTP